MLIEKNNFIIETDIYFNYLNEVIIYLDSKLNNIMKFFELKEFKYKPKIVIWNNINKYKKHIETLRNYEDWICGDVFDDNINMLSIEECHNKTISHKDMTIQEFKENIVHELVHKVHFESIIDDNCGNFSFFMEALATNLVDNKNITSIDITKDELMNHIFERDPIKSYDIMYTIGKYMLDNYSHKQILQYIKYPKTLEEDLDKILEEIRSDKDERK